MGIFQELQERVFELFVLIGESLVKPMNPPAGLSDRVFVLLAAVCIDLPLAAMLM